jgi:hypothetical protein
VTVDAVATESILDALSPKPYNEIDAIITDLAFEQVLAKPRQA